MDNIVGRQNQVLVGDSPLNAIKFRPGAEEPLAGTPVEGDEDGRYINATFSTSNRRAMWAAVREELAGGESQPSLLGCSIVVCTGEFEWDEDAHTELNDWNHSGMKPVPDHGRLEHYKGRRLTHVIKLSMISAVSAGHGLNVALDDFNRARKWLLETEIRMPDVFRAIRSKSDDQLLRDLHHAIYVQYGRIGEKDRKPVPNSFVVDYLANKATAERIKILIKTAQDRQFIRPAGFGDAWIPNDITKIFPE